MKYILVIGTRTFNDYMLLFRYLEYHIRGRKDICIVSGGAKGADKLAKDFAEYNGYEYKEFQAEWNKYGKRAGYIRNEQMHKFISEQKERCVIAFWDGQSKGTAHSFDLAKKYHNPLLVVNYMDISKCS